MALYVEGMNVILSNYKCALFFIRYRQPLELVSLPGQPITK